MSASQRCLSRASSRLRLHPKHRLPADTPVAQLVGNPRNVAPVPLRPGLRRLTVTGRLQLSYGRGLVELRDGAEHLANEHCGRRVLGEMVGRAGRNQGHAEVPKMIVTGELHSLAKFIAMRRASSR